MTQSPLHTQPTGGLTEMGLAGVWGPELHNGVSIVYLLTHSVCTTHLIIIESGM